VAVLVSNHRTLLCHRSPERDWYPDVWDLPGGHVNAFETAPEALARELEEELGVQVLPPASPPMARIDAPGVELLVWAIDRWDGEVANLSPSEHDAIGWFDAAGLVDLDLAHPAYRPMLLKALR
jgi:8-oxo-dGTP diphosphatase